MNGNGHAVLPPGTLTQMRRYRQPVPERPRGLKLVGRILLFLFTAVAVMAAATAGGAYLFFHQSVAAVKDNSKSIGIKSGDLPGISNPHEATVILLIGYDRRAGDAQGEPSRSDTVMLLRIDPQLKAISMLSFPRDLKVPIHCPGKPVYTDRINAAYSLCGARGTLQTVKSLIAPVPINNLITVNFRGFKEIVDHLGGVWIDVDHRYLNQNKNVGQGYTYATINLWPGYQHLNGVNALSYVRFRHTDSDLLRVVRQQQFVRALKEQVARNFSIFDLPTIIGSLTRNVAVGGNFGGKKVLSYAQLVYHLPAGHFFQAKIEGLTGYYELDTDPANIDAAVRDFANPDVEAPTTATQVLEGRKPKVPRPEETSVIVLNGNHIEGSAARATDQLRGRGYQVVLPRPDQTGNAPSFNHFDTDVYYNPGYKRAKAAATVVGRLFEPAHVHAMTKLIAPLSNAAMVTIVVGRTFHGTLAPTPPRVIPKRQPAEVAAAVDTTLPLVTKVRRRLPFRLMYPTVLERSSIPDPEVPVRDYRLDKNHRALRLTFRTGTRNYWGIQELNVGDAPILSERNFRRFYHGREFDLYYSGAHLHMIVLHGSEASYWVVNTLDDELSNETMLAIARGLKPLKGKVGRGVR